MNEYVLKVDGGDKVAINHKGPRHVEISVGDNKATVNVNDLAMIVKECLPIEDASEMFAAIDEKEIKSGKVRVKIRAKTDIKKGEDVVFSFDVNKYLDKHGNPTGIRATSYGFIY